MSNLQKLSTLTKTINEQIESRRLIAANGMIKNKKRKGRKEKRKMKRKKEKKEKEKEKKKNGGFGKEKKERKKKRKKSDSTIYNEPILLQERIPLSILFRFLVKFRSCEYGNCNIFSLDAS